MALIIKSFWQILLGNDQKSYSKRVYYGCGKSGHYIAKCPYASYSDRDEDKKGKKMEKKYYHKKKGDEAHAVREWDFDEISTDSSHDEDAVNFVINKVLLSPNIGHKCLMAKKGKQKVQPRITPNYNTFNDEGDSSDNEEDLSVLFKGLNPSQIKKKNK
jgi:hypothetical protein